MRRVLVTGARILTDRDAVDEALWAQARLAGGLNQLIVVHGDCPRGADRFAREFCERYPKVQEERHPADWDTHGKAAGFIRNHNMVTLGADVCLAFPRGESRGTLDCVSRAKSAGIAVVYG